ncbi:MAG: hypothetical protein H6728_15210 [Myxococcales bacterium]|nr:hypothetical protein [Myxococcales bacterium]MCB9644419.1 hypothetical protein [Myxococcales bacterium]
MNKIEKVRALLRLAECEGDKPEGIEAKRLAERMIERYEIRPWELGEDRSLLQPRALPAWQPTQRFNEEPWNLEFEMRFTPPPEAWRRLLMFALAQRMRMELRLFSCVVLRSKESGVFEKWHQLYRHIEGRVLEAVKGIREHERNRRCERLIRNIEQQLQYLPEDQLRKLKLTEDLVKETTRSGSFRVRWA